MSVESAIPSASLERLSALVDGELDDASVARACAQWREDSSVRCAWHEYQLIGDLLRSDDLAFGAESDAVFVSALRVRLADEPVVLAPQSHLAWPEAARAPVANESHGVNGRGASRGWRQPWMVPSVAAAGFVAIAGVLLVMRGPGVPAGLETGATLAAAPVVAPRQDVPTTVQIAEAGKEPEVPAFSGPMVRNARLDRYLAAHKQFAGSSALGVPSAFLRNATAAASNR